MPADLAIQIERTIGLCFMLTILFAVKLAMLMLKSYALYIYELTLLVERTRNGETLHPTRNR